MKILIVCQYFHPEPFRITDISAQLVKMGHGVDVITGIPNYPEGRFYDGYGLLRKRKETVGGARVVRVPIVPRGRNRRLQLACNYVSFLVSGTARAARVRRGQYDIVLVYQLSPITMAIPGIVAARRAGVPLVHYVMDLWPESLSAVDGTGSRLVLSAAGRLVDWIYQHCGRILVSSPGFMRSIAERGQDPGKLHYVPQYPEDEYRHVDVDPLDPIRKEMPQGFNVAFTGNIGMAQGLSVVIEAALRLRKYAEIHWLLIGDGRARAELEKAVAGHGLGRTILFLGRQPRGKIPKYLALADAALLPLGPDKLFALTLPAKLQSYLACGIPIIGSVDGDAARVIRESGAGLAGPAGDAAALAGNVLRMFGASPAERTAFRERALAYHLANFSRDHVMNMILGHLEREAFPERPGRGGRR